MGVTMGMGTSVTDVLNIWNDMGVFSYVIPFLLIFAVVFAILDKTKMFSKDNDRDENKGIIAIIAVSVGLLSLQFDFVSEFFAVIFPRFGIGLSIFLVVIIFLGFLFPKKSDKDWSNKVAWIGWVVAIGVVLWALSEWDEWSSYIGFGGWFSDNVWALIVLGIIIAVIAYSTSGKKKSYSSSSSKKYKKKRYSSDSY